MKTYRFFLIITFLIVYGSLYPLDITEPPPSAWRGFLGDWSLYTSSGDVLGNIALFFPFGLAGTWSLSMRNAAIRDALVLALAFIFAFSLQLAQVWLPSRSAALVDVVWNLAGTGFGIVAAHLAVGRAGAGMVAIPSARLVPLGLLILWLLAELSPLVPSLDLQKFKDALKPLILGPEFHFPDITAHAAGVFTAGSALAMLTPHPSKWLFGLISLVLAGKLIVVHLTLDASLLIGLMVGYLAWLLLPTSHRKERFGLAFIVLFAAWAIVALTPFSPVPGGSFNSIPFATMLKGSMEVNVRGVAQSLFIYTGLLWFAQMMVGRISGVMVGLILWACLLELTQMLILGRTADITEPILILLIGWLLTVLQRQQKALFPPAQPLNEVTGSSARKILDLMPRIGWLATLGISVLGMAVLMWAMLRVPGVPYNVRELFLGNGNFFFLMVFAIALLWVGAGAALAGHKFSNSSAPYLSLPLWVSISSLVSLLLLSGSVSQESIGDIAGSNNLYWFVVNQNIWGEWWRDIFLILGTSVVDFIERPVRFAALYSPLPVFLGLMLFIVDLRHGNVLTVRRALVLFTSALLWLWLAKAITFDWSSTDNLNELIARDGPLGWGGGGYLYALLGLCCAVAVLCARVPIRLRTLMLAGLTCIISIPLGWLLLNLGLEPQIEKYGNVFSGAQFLLGPDRSHLMAERELFLRWAVIQTGFVITVSMGIRFAQACLDQTIYLPQRGETVAQESDKKS